MKKLLIVLPILLMMTACGDASGKTAVLHTTEGDIMIDLYTEKAPETTKNFIEHASAGRYDGVPFHRVIEDFMIQTGDFENKNGTGGYSYKGPGTYLEDEFDPSLTHEKGAVSMANRGPNTGGSQFFIVHAEEGTPWLNGAHAVFGKVVNGMAVVDKIATTETGPGDVPVKEILIESVEIK